MMRSFLSYLVVILFLGSCEKEDVKSDKSVLTSFSIQELTQAFSISENKLVEAVVEADTDLDNLTAVFKVSDKAKVFIGKDLQTSGYSKNNFSNPLEYKIQAEDGSSSDYTVIVHKDAKINSFSIKELPYLSFQITEDNMIVAEADYGTNLSELTAVFDITEESNLYINDYKQVSGTTQNDFTEPLNYTLVSSRGDEKHYSVDITIKDNMLPEADAGEDQLILVEDNSSLASVILDASNSVDHDGEIVSYQWNMGNEVISTEKIVNLDLNVGLHEIELTVLDNHSAQGKDQININVEVYGEYSPIDENANQETVSLYKNLANIANSQNFIFGQEFPMSFKLGGTRDDLSTSDCKDVTGDHPGVFGIDPHYMLYKSSQQRQLHIDEAKLAYENGSVVTFDFHQLSKNDKALYFEDISSLEDKSLVYDIVNNQNGAREWFYEEMDDVLSIINNDLGFPIVFRLFHEMDGNWFWWGTKTKNHNEQLYIDFYRLSVDYIKERTNLVLFAWSPNAEFNTGYYPGDNYVDVVGFDIYEPIKSTLKNTLIELSKFAYTHNKVAILAETGYRNNFISTKPTFWTSIVLDAILEGGNEIRIAWVLSWFNAPWHSSQDDLFIPDHNSPQNAKDDFIEFENHESTLFQEEVNNLNIYSTN